MKSRIFAHIAQFFIMAALVVGTGFALRPLQLFIHQRMIELKSQIVVAIESSTGRAISYDSISPSIFRYVEVRNLAIYGRQGEPTVLLRINRLKIYYNVFAVIEGKMAQALDSISIENSRFSLDTTKDQDVVRFLQSVLSPSGTTAAPGLPRVTIQGRNLTLTLTDPNGTVHATGLFFTLVPGTSQVQVRLHTEVDATLAKPLFSVTHLSSPISIVATLHAVPPSEPAAKDVPAEPAFDADASVSLDHLVTNSFNLARQSFRLTYTNGVVSARKIEDRAPIDISARYIMKSGELQTQVQAENFVPDQYFSVRQPLDGLRPWLSTSFTGSGSVNVTMPTGDVRYAATLVARPRNGNLRGVRQLDADVHGDARLLVAQNLLVQTEYGSAQFSGDVELSSMLPDGTLTLRNVSAGGMAPVNTEFALARNAGVLDITDPSISLGATTLYKLHANLSPGSGSLGFDGGFAMDPGGVDTVSVTGAIPVSAAGGPTTVSVITRELPVRSFYQALSAVAPGLIASGLAIPHGLPTPSIIPETLTLDSRFSVSLRDNELSVTAPELHLFDRTKRDNTLAMSLAADPKQIEVSGLSASFNGYSASGRIVADFLKGGDLTFRGAVTLQDVPYAFHGSYQAGKQLTITEQHGLTAELYIGNLQQIAFHISARDFPIVLGSRNSQISIQAVGMYSGPSTWEVNLNDFTLSNAPFVPVAGTTVRFAGRVTPGRATLDRVEYSDGISSATGNGTISYVTRPGTSSLLDRLTAGVFLQLENRTPAESYRADLTLADGQLGGDIQIRNLPLLRLGVNGIQGGLDGQVRLSGTVVHPVADAEVSLNNGSLGGQPLTASAVGRYAAGTVTVNSVNASYNKSVAIAAKADLELKTGKAMLEATYTDSSQVPTPLVVGINAHASYTPQSNPFDIAGIVAGNLRAEATVTGLPIQKNLGAVWNFAMTKNGSNIAIEGGPQNSLKGNFAGNGDFVVSADAPLPFTFQADGRFKASQIEANINNLHFNLSIIKRVLDFQIFRLTQGDVRGSLRINGSASDPDFYGTLSVTGARGNLAYTPNELGPSNTFMIFEEKHVTMTRFDVPIGRSNGQVAGTFTMDRWQPTAFTLQIDVPSSGGMKVDHTFGNVTVNGYTNGRINIVGTPQETVVTGHLVAYSTSIALVNISGQAPPIQVQEQGQIPVKVDLTIESGKQVEFLWPSTTIPVLRGYAKLGQTIHIGVATDTGDFSLKGNVGIQSGEIFYFERSFYIRSGVIAFNETQNYFDPRLTVDAEIREVTDTTNNLGTVAGTTAGQVRIRLVATDERLSEFTPRFVSDPPMTDSQIVALLSGNFFGEFANNNLNLGTAALLASDLVGQFSLVRDFENAVRDALSLDLFSVRTQLFSNLLRGTIPGTQYPLDNTSPSLGTYLDNTTVFLGKYLGTDLFMELLLQLKAQNPYVNTNQVRSFGGLVIDPEINLDWRTPFFDLQWNFFPRTPNTLFLTDNTVTLSWGYSY